jgi:CRP/FNR family cyclic AMP-dependent transcriptional regulator
MQTLGALTDLIKSHPFLAGLDPEFYEFFHDCATVRRFASQQQIFHEGGEADHFYLILSGEIALETFVPGCGTVTIQRLGPKEALGWSWLFPPHEWHFTATTLAPTEVISFNAEALRAKAAENRDFRDELLTRVAKTLLERLQSTRMQLIDLYGIRP